MRLILRAYLSLALLGTVSLSKPARATQYTITNLGTLGGGSSQGAAINATGSVVGTSKIASGQDRAFLYKDGQMTSLGTLGGSISSARDINDSGQVVGESENAGAVLRAFVWSGASMLDLGTQARKFSMATGINASGVIVGYFEKPSGAIRGFLANANPDINEVFELGTLGGSSSQAESINNGGRIVGTSAAASGQRAFRTNENGDMIDLGALGGTSAWSNGLDVNASGQVVGTSKNLDDKYEAFIYSGSKMTGLGVLDGYYSELRAINTAGVAVGFYRQLDDSPRAVVTVAGQLVNLNTLIDASLGWTLQFAEDINDAGQIVGTGMVDGNQRAFLLTPLAEPDPPVDSPAETSAPPTLSVSGSKKIVTRAASAAVKGTAAGEVTNVNYRIGSASFQKATGITRWKFKVALKRGRNVVTVQASGPGGTSAPARITITRKAR